MTQADCPYHLDSDTNPYITEGVSDGTRIIWYYKSIDLGNDEWDSFNLKC